MARGFFVVFEGPDRAGKTTQVARLVQALVEAGVGAERIRFPTRTGPLGTAIESHLADVAPLDARSAHLLFSADRWSRADVIRGHLLAGCVVVCDRYAYSGIAFSRAAGVPEEWSLASDRGLPAADLVVYLDLSNQAQQRRTGFGDERYEREDFQKKARTAYEGLVESNWKRVDAAAPVDEVAGHVWEAVCPLLEQWRNHSLPPLAELWAAPQLVRR